MASLLKPRKIKGEVRLALDKKKGGRAREKGERSGSISGAGGGKKRAVGRGKKRAGVDTMFPAPRRAPLRSNALKRRRSHWGGGEGQRGGIAFPRKEP